MFEGTSGAILLAILDYLYIFVVLGGLAILTVILGKIVKKYETKKTNKVTKVISPVINTPEMNEEEGNDDRLIAVITAALSFYLEKPKSSFKVVNIKKYRISSMSPWATMGKQELMLRKNNKY
ncbi:MAG: OadG family protein [Candidatus Atribacteria bacterium]|nr:OadG family protein [Candidatus Atribacteria bacterium]